MSLLAALFLMTQPIAPEALEVFESRETDLITLSSQLGRLHRLNQVCPSSGNITVYRERMKEIIDGERPRRETRESMIAHFNQGYRDMTELHFTCSNRAEADFRNQAMRALWISERLASPFFLR